MGSEQIHGWDNRKVNHPTHFRLMCSRRASSHLFLHTGSTSAVTYKTRGVFHAYNTSHWIFLPPTINSLLLVVKALDQSHIQTPEQSLVMHNSRTARYLMDRRTLRCAHPGCEHRASCQSNLNHHQLTHSGERRYTCRLCGRAWSRAWGLRRHYRDVHGLDTRNASSHCVNVPLATRPEEVAETEVCQITSDGNSPLTKL